MEPPTRRIERQTTYADLTDTDLLVDKSGNEWAVLNPHKGTSDTILFTLGDPLTRAPRHPMTKPAKDTCTVRRVEMHAEENARLDAEFPSLKDTQGGELPAEVIAQFSAEEDDAVRAAEVTGIPIDLPSFESLTMLERKSHLYLLHGIYADDKSTLEDLATMHAEAHAGWEAQTLKSKYVAHTHNERLTFEQMVKMADATGETKVAS